MRSQSIQGDIRKLLRARSSVEQLHSLLKEKGVFTSVSRLNSVTTSGRSSLRAKMAVYSSRISNLDRTASPTRKELQVQTLTLIVLILKLKKLHSVNLRLSSKALYKDDFCLRKF